MPKPRVYVETTIPNVYYETRTSPEMVARQVWTRAWWAHAVNKYELVTSSKVLAELDRGTGDQVARRKSMLKDLRLLSVDPPVPAIVSFYIRHRLMPANPPDDAYHLAAASYHGCDFMVTWDLRHLANPRKALHIRRINTILTLHVPELVTPKHLMLKGNDV
jgi:predicted nucleic acid-binding protein